MAISVLSEIVHNYLNQTGSVKLYMKKFILSFIAFNRRGLLIPVLFLSLAVFGYTAWGSISEIGEQIIEYFGGDPDMGPFDPGMSKADFMLARASAIAQKRGVEKDKPFDPQLRIDAIRQLEKQESDRSLLPPSMERDSVLAAWTEIGPNPIPNGQTTSVSTAVSGRVTAISIHPTNPLIAFVGTAQGGLYRTLDGGTTWTPMMDAAASMSIGAVTIDPTDPTIVFVGTGEGNLSLDSFFGVGLYRINNALSGSPVVNGPFQSRTNGGSGNAFINTSITKIVVDPTNHDNIFVGNTLGFGGISGSQHPGPSGFVGLHYCANATAATPTFVRVLSLPGGGAAGISDMVMEPGTPNTLIVGQQDYAGGSLNGIYRSTNALLGGGLSSTWTKVLDYAAVQNNIKLAINKIGATVTVLAATGASNGRLLRSVDGGATFPTTLTAANGFCGGQCFYDIAVAIEPADSTKMYIAGSTTGSPTRIVARSTNSGTNFTAIETGLHADSHAIEIAPSNVAVAYTGNDGGVWRSDNVNTATPASVVWNDVNTATFRATQFMGLAVHPIDPNFTIGGTQDNGTNYYKPDATWTRSDYGDGGYAVIDQSAVNTATVNMFHTYFNSSTLQGYGFNSSPGTAFENWTFRGCNGVTGNNIPCGGSVLFYAPLEQGPGTPNTIYYGANILYRSANNGLNHTAVSQNLTNAISAIGISPQNDNVRIVGQNNGGLFGTATGSTTLTNLDTGNVVPASFIARAVIDPNNGNTAYVTLSAYNVANVWRTTNFNNATPTWTSLPGTGGNTLPQIPVNGFLVDPANSAILYAGTDIGVYSSIDSGVNWLPFGTGLPRVAVFDIAKTSGSLIRIATHGRGMWQTAALAGATPTPTNTPTDTPTNTATATATNTFTRVLSRSEE